MVSIYDIKPYFQSLLRPIVTQLAKRKITPNQITIAAMLLSMAIGALLILFYENKYMLLSIPFVMFIRMALNAIDGMLAKEHNMKTPLGNILNELGDVISDTCLFIPFAFISIFSPSLIIAIIILAIISEMAGILGSVIGATRRYDGPMGKSDRAFVFSLLAILVAFNLINELVSLIVLSVTLALIVINIIIRIRRAIMEVE